MGIARLLAKGWIIFCLFAGAHALRLALLSGVPLAPSLADIGICVLLLACVNFMNLSTARSEKRAKEVGIRKANGSLRWQLVRQFFVESILIAAVSFVLAIVVAQLLLPFFNNLASILSSV